LLNIEFNASILCPALCRVITGNRFGFTFADGFQAIPGYASLHQPIFHCLCPAQRERPIVFIAAHAICVAGNFHLNIGIGNESFMGFL
jgi:hypothetical protein